MTVRHTASTAVGDARVDDLRIVILDVEQCEGGVLMVACFDVRIDFVGEVGSSNFSLLGQVVSL